MSSFAKNTVKLVSGTVMAQVINLVTIPLITRIYAPEAFGAFGVFVAITMILFPVSTLHYHRAMMIPEDKDDAVNLMVLSFLIIFVVSGLSALCIAAIHFGVFAAGAGLQPIKNYLWLIPVTVFFQGCELPLRFWALRNRAIAVMSVTRVAESLADKGFVLLYASILPASAAGMIVGRIVGPFVAQYWLFHKTVLREISAMWKIVSLSEMKRLAWRYKNFGWFSTLSLVITRGATSVPVLFLAFYFSPEIVGFYALTNRIINIPMLFVGEALSKTFLQRATGEEKGESLRDDTAGLFGYLVTLSLPPTFILLFFGDTLYRYFFGVQWGEAGVYAQILSLSFFSMFLFRPLSVLYDAFERLKERFIVSLVFLITSGGAIILGAKEFASVYVALSALSVVTFIVCCCACVHLLYLVGVKPAAVARIFVGKFLVMVPLIVVLALTKIFLSEHDLLTLAICIASLVVQGIVLIAIDPYLSNAARRFMRKINHRRNPAKIPRIAVEEERMY